MTKTNNNESQPTTNTNPIRKKSQGTSKMIRVLTFFLQAFTLALLGLGCGNLIGLSMSLDLGLATLMLVSSILTGIAACAIQYFDPTNGDTQ